MEAIRLNKFLSEKGICSRREADRLIEAGKVTVNGQAAVMGAKVDPEDEIIVDGKPVPRKKTKAVLIAVNKPAGVVCTTAEFKGEVNIVELVNYPSRIYPIGRLDKESEGLILMTNQGELVNAISKSAGGHEKEYVVKVNKPVTEIFLKKMREGMELPELAATTLPCECKRSGEKEFHIIIRQGLNRQIRRMCEACGYQVTNLKRIRIMNMQLGNIPLGKYRNIAGAEYDTLLRMLEEDGVNG